MEAVAVDLQVLTVLQTRAEAMGADLVAEAQEDH